MRDLMAIVTTVENVDTEKKTVGTRRDLKKKEMKKQILLMKMNWFSKQRTWIKKNCNLNQEGY